MGMVAAVALLPLLTALAPDLHTRGVNLVAGDLSIVAGYARADAPEREQVQGHLRYAHDVLARVDTSGWPTELRFARARNLERLAAYAEAGQFPYNDDHPDAKRPTFVDESGAICAVGALFALDRGRDAAVRVAAEHKYSFIAQIDDGELAMWQQHSGLASEELALIQPSYAPKPNPNNGDTPLWVPWGLLDRMQLAPFRTSATTELGSRDGFDSASLTLHAQMSTPCDCKIGFYGTLPASIALVDDSLRVAAAGGPLPPRDTTPRTILGTADVGLFGGNRRGRNQTLFRLGALLPTGTRTPRPWLPSARAGDAVLELPRSAGVRVSTSKLNGWRSVPGITDFYTATRIDLGVDIAQELATPGHPTHVIPRAGIGALFVDDGFSFSLDTALSIDPFVDDRANLRWSGGLTVRKGRYDGTGWFIHPAVSFAVVRAPEGWSGNVAIDLAATARPRGTYHRDEY